MKTFRPLLALATPLLIIACGSKDGQRNNAGNEDPKTASTNLINLDEFT